MPPRQGNLQRAHRTFWSLVGISALAAGALSRAVTQNPGPLTGLLVAVSGTLMLFAVALAARVMIALDRVRRVAPRSGADDAKLAAKRSDVGGEGSRPPGSRRRAHHRRL